MLIDETLDKIHKRVTWLERAAALAGRPRERLVALATAEERFRRLHAQHDLALQAVLIAAQLGQTRPEPEDPLRRAERRLTDLLTDVIRDAVRSGDLPMRAGLSSEELAFTIWALTFGTRTLMHTRVATHELAIADGHRVGREALSLLLDSLGWRPLTSECDYDAVRQRVGELLFRSNGSCPDKRRLSYLSWHRSRLLGQAEIHK